MKKLFYDTETTGFHPNQNSIHSLHAKIEIDDVIIDSITIRMRPHPKAKVEPEALRISHTTMDELMSFTSQEQGFFTFKSFLDCHQNRFDKTDKIYLVGYNNRKFDDLFLEKWFALNNDGFMYARFYETSLDTMILAAEYLLDRRINMSSFKLHRVAKELGIDVDDTKTHNADYDVWLTREVYRIVTGRQIEI